MSATIDFGIDLGTTNSCVARWEGGRVRIFQNNDQMNVTPSAVYINRGGRKIIGLRAHSALRTDPNNVATEFKRWMGQKDRREFAASKQSLSAEELSAEILKSLREDVRRQTGIDMTTAVITVPAAFGALQCEATARAAQLSGILEAPLLQEPIAAAIGYGVRTESADQRWLVFDLGGGTLDIAVVSTRDGRLNVLEHRGNNLCGGKDIDRLIVDKVLLPAIEEQFDIHSIRSKGNARALFQQLRSEAERAKIALSTDKCVHISLFDLGDDDSKRPIELELDLTRDQLEGMMEPMLRDCCFSAQEALADARISGCDLDRILLVGGPTQSPLIRSRLTEEIGAPVDFSIDPMTVVARGAALYATTLQRTTPSMTVPAGDCISLKLAYEPVSADLRCVVAGRILNVSPGLEVKVDAEGGFWTSGWLGLTDGIFETSLLLKEGDVTTFWVYLRDAQGRLIETDTPEFKIRHGLVPSSPPLPHSLCIEVINSGGKPELDIVFPKGTPLPTEKTVKYRAAHALIPGKIDSTLYIKTWEGEFLEAPDANEWVGNLELSHDGVNRRIPEGSEIEVTIQIDTSRKISVAAFVPILNQHFLNLIYVPQRGEVDYSKLATTVDSETEEYTEELQKLSDSEPSDPNVQQQIKELRESISALESKASSHVRQNASADPEDAKRMVAESKSIRGRIIRLGHQTSQQSRSRVGGQFLETVEQASNVVDLHGNPLEKQALSSLRRELDRAVLRGEDKLIQQIVKEFDELRRRVLFRQDWYWRDIFESLAEPGYQFIDNTEAKRLVAKGHAALNSGDGDELKEVVRSLWRLCPKGEAEELQERVAQAGLRRY